jgi:hypothetical protein
MTVSNSAQFNSTYIYNQRLQPCWVYTTAAPKLSGCDFCLQRYDYNRHDLGLKIHLQCVPEKQRKRRRYYQQS